MGLFVLLITIYIEQMTTCINQAKAPFYDVKWKMGTEDNWFGEATEFNGIHYFYMYETNRTLLKKFSE